MLAQSVGKPFMSFEVSGHFTEHIDDSYSRGCNSSPGHNKSILNSDLENHPLSFLAS